MPSAVDDLLARRSQGARRADARRNTERLIAAARAALDEDGLALTTREIARRAGVGLGTVYRQIPSLESLVDAILVDAIAEMTAQATQALQDPDPWHAFAGFAETFVQLRAASCGLHAALSSDHDADIDGQVTRLREAVGKLVRHAQRQGVLRADVDWRDVPFVLASAIPADHTIGIPAKADQWRRNLKIILDGLRAWPKIVGHRDPSPPAADNAGAVVAPRPTPKRDQAAPSSQKASNRDVGVGVPGPQWCRSARLELGTGS